MAVKWGWLSPFYRWRWKRPCTLTQGCAEVQWQGQDLESLYMFPHTHAVSLHPRRKPAFILRNIYLHIQRAKRFCRYIKSNTLSQSVRLCRMGPCPLFQTYLSSLSPFRTPAAPKFFLFCLNVWHLLYSLLANPFPRNICMNGSFSSVSCRLSCYPINEASLSPLCPSPLACYPILFSVYLLIPEINLPTLHVSPTYLPY